MRSVAATPVRLLITGIPGTGKTTLGEHLRTAFGFDHIDFERPLPFKTWSDLGERVANATAGVVVTWGFVPDAPDSICGIHALRQIGFVQIWFDGDRSAALRHFVRRGTVGESLFHIQLSKIDSTRIVEQLTPIIVNPFTEAGDFRSLEELAEAALNAASG